MKYYNIKTCTKSRLLFMVFVLLITVLIKKCFDSYNGNVLSNQRERLQSDVVHLNLGKDYNCIRTIEEYRDVNGIFFIPPDKILTTLPKHAVDCLYQRITTTIQIFCAKRSRHGSIKDGWNICVDGCYKPNDFTRIHVISTVNDSVNIQSINQHYKAVVTSYMPSTKSKTSEIYVTPKKRNGQTTTLDMWSEVVNYVSTGQDVLIIDVGYLTEKVVDHVIKNGMLNKMQQLSIRISYGDPKSGIKYLAALKHLKKLFEVGFRIYWSRPELTGILQNNKNRTSCVYLDMGPLVAYCKAMFLTLDKHPFSSWLCRMYLYADTFVRVGEVKSDVLNRIYNVCRSLQDTKKQDKDVNMIQNRTDHTYLVIPDDQALSKLNNKEITELYIRYLTSVQIHCREVIRLGSVPDGGWNVCHDKSYRPSLPCLVYSFGINWDFSFDDAIVEAYSCDVHSFDPSMQRTDFRRAGHIWFHNLGLGNKTEIYGKDKWKISTLKDIYSDLGHKSTTVDILKIDIEAMEWISIPNMIQTGAIVNVRQLLVEFHAYSVLLQHLHILRSIYNEGFRIYWYHRNPGKRNIIQGKFVENTACYEVYFIRI